MCYCGCRYESYPRGPNEGCVCKASKGASCALEPQGLPFTQVTPATQATFGAKAPASKKIHKNRQRVTCRVSTKNGVLRLSGSLSDVLDWLRAKCPAGKVLELAGVRV